MEKNPTIWVLADDRAGNVGQCMGVAHALGLAFDRKDIAYGLYGKLPNFLLGARLKGLSPDSQKKISPPWPDLVIAAGRRTAPVARYIKKASRGRAKLVQIMDPGALGSEEFDLICVPAHDAKPLQANHMKMVGAPHCVDGEKLRQAKQKWQERFADLPRPLIGLIVGGATKNKVFSEEMARELGQRLNDVADQKGAGLLITTSRRTGAVAQALFDEITVPSFCFKWGDEGENPYFGFLSCADYLVVTGDSVSMCSEACATGKPVMIYAPSGMVSDKHQRLHNSLYQGGFAHPFEGGVQESSGATLNAADEIALAIKTLLA